MFENYKHLAGPGLALLALSLGIGCNQQPSPGDTPEKQPFGQSKNFGQAAQLTQEPSPKDAEDPSNIEILHLKKDMIEAREIHGKYKIVRDQHSMRLYVGDNSKWHNVCIVKAGKPGENEIITYFNRDLQKLSMPERFEPANLHLLFANLDLEHSDSDSILAGLVAGNIRYTLNDTGNCTGAKINEWKRAPNVSTTSYIMPGLLLREALKEGMQPIVLQNSPGISH